jgi:hypothetical protein
MDSLHGLINEGKRKGRALVEIIIARVSGCFGRLPEALRRHGLHAASCEAHARGIRLLSENLNPVQRAQYRRFGYFDVAGGETGRRYRIRNGLQLNVDELDNKGRAVRRLCFMPEGDLVAGDLMLAQKLALELFELDTLEVANTFSPDPDYFIFGLP